MTTTRHTLASIKAANKAIGHHFFDRSALRFFNSHVERGVYQGNGGVFFVTSEQFVGSSGIADPRKYTVRRFDPQSGRIETHGEFNTLRTLDDARDVAKRAAKGN